MTITTDQLGSALLNGHSVNSGVLFARVANDIKAEKRALVAAFFEAMPVSVLSILTFPNVKWEFERHGLLGNQNAAWRGTGNVRIVGIEREANVYRAAMKEIPARKDRNGFGLKFFSTVAGSGVRTRAIRAFLHCSFEEFASSVDWFDSPVPYFFNAAWLDFCGPLTVTRAMALDQFLTTHCVRPMRLALTFMDGRWPTDATAFWGVDRLGGIERWLSERGEIVGRDRYVMNKVAMIQYLMKLRAA